MLARMHTTARADSKELSAKEALCRSTLERWPHGNYRTGIVLFLYPIHMDPLTGSNQGSPGFGAHVKEVLWQAALL